MTTLKYKKTSNAAALFLTLLLPLFSSQAISNTSAPQAEEGLINYNIPAGELTQALRQFAEQTGLQLAYESNLTTTKTIPALKAQLTPEQALTRLLQNTGLHYQYLDERTVAVIATKPTALDTGNTVTGNAGEGLIRVAQNTSEENKNATEKSPESVTAEDSGRLQEVVVTGTNIRGVYPASSPVEVYTAADIARTGATTTEQFIQKLPQNLGTRTQFAQGATFDTRINQDAVAGIDLRGLGVGTTLVLMNGRRLALSELGRSADVSMIPASAIERVEVLTDGASAIYGSDAIGGVVNFVLRDDFDGAQTQLGYGTVSDGGLRQYSATQTFGHSWDSGNGLLSYDYFDVSPLLSAERTYSSTTQPGWLTPEQKRHNVLATFSQDLGENWTVGGDFAFGRRKTENRSASTTNANPLNHILNTYEGTTQQYFANAALDWDVSSKLHASVTGTYSDVDVAGGARNVRFNQNPPLVTLQPGDKNYTARDLTAMLDGGLWTLPGGDLRFSLGGGLLDEEYAGINSLSGQIATALGRKTTYAFGELFVPLVGGEQGVTWIHRLELSFALRYTGYSDESKPALNRDFGDAVDPKVGLLWAPAESFHVRATYGTSFRAPHLTELDPTNASNAIASNVGIPFPNGPISTRLIIQSFAVPELEPETAENFTIGFDLRPRGDSGFKLTGTYYSIDYTDRIAVAPTDGTAFLQTPALYPDAIYPAPFLAFVENALRTTTNILNLTNISLTDPHAAALALMASPNFWIQDGRTKNLSLSRQDGIDLSISDRFDTAWGNLRAGANVTHIFNYEQQGSRNSPVVSIVDRPLHPVDLRGRAYVGMTRGGFDGTLNINYVDGYVQLLVAGPAPIDSWTTLDMALSYNFRGSRLRFFDGLTLSASVQNLFDTEPPFLTQQGSEPLIFPIGFDPTNANPLGRLLSVSVQKSW